MCCCREHRQRDCRREGFIAARSERLLAWHGVGDVYPFKRGWHGVSAVLIATPGGAAAEMREMLSDARAAYSPTEAEHYRPSAGVSIRGGRMYSVGNTVRIVFPVGRYLHVLNLEWERGARAIVVRPLVERECALLRQPYIGA